MKNKVRWQREGADLVPYMFEQKDGIWDWRRYNCSKVNANDIDCFSKGYPAFLKAVKLGYEVKKKQEN